MSQLIFDEKTMINNNLFKFEQRLHTHLNKYAESGAILCTYFPQRENSTTVDRGTRDIDQLFGKHSPLRYDQINNMPLYSSGTQTNPDNTDESQIEDINITGEFTILPNTIVPKPLDFFMINHLKMVALFEVTNVQYDSMRVDGFYKITYRLHSTSDETVQQLKTQVIDEYNVELNAIGTKLNPIIKKDDYILRSGINQMVSKMIMSYRALFYNERHNCFLYHNPEDGLDYFDMCGNEFIAKHGLMNIENSTSVIILHEKINDYQMPLFYNNSIYNWIELGAPERLLQKFYYICNTSNGYPYSSFYLWHDEVWLMQPISITQAGMNFQKLSFFDDDQLNAFMGDKEPSSEYDKLIWKYIHKGTDINIHDISLHTADMLITSLRHIDIYLYTPIIIFIIRKILRMN